MPIALLTDFGTRDYFVGAMKGMILSIDPKAIIVDISHEIEPQNIQSAAFVLGACYHNFPTGTVFVCVVDPGVGSNRKAIAVEAGEYFFVGPDNGLFSFVYKDRTRAFTLENERFYRHPVSPTFHGRDIFAPVAAHLSLGVPVAEFGPPADDPVKLSNIPVKQITNDEFEGRVIHIDHFGNLVTNITAKQASRAFKLEMGGRLIVNRREFFAGAAAGEPFAILGSAGFIEIAVDRESAADKLNAKVGTRVVMRLS